MRRLILIFVLAITTLLSAGAGAIAIDRSVTSAPMTMSGDMDAPCPQCPDNTIPGSHLDHRSCSDCAVCGLIAAVAPATGLGSPLPKFVAVAQAVRSLPTGHLDAHEPPPPRA